MQTVYYDAWINDSDEDPVLSLILTIVFQLATLPRYDKSNIFKLASETIKLLTGKD
ncbi:hypothetical protein [Lactobacillus sp. PSON]|uniref:hypothetical protein n=1 Tax=Lactobacillus sp. PSON TaxID=3455454 RepID=UPI004042A9B3